MHLAGAGLVRLSLALAAALLAAASLPAAARAGESPSPPVELPAEWLAEAEETQAAIRKAVAEGAAAGRKEQIYIDLGGRSQRGRVVSADETELVVSLPGMQVPLPWEKISPKRTYFVGRKYLQMERAATRTALGRYCLVHGLLEEAEEEFTEALRIDAGVVEEVRQGMGYARKRRLGAAAAARKRVLESIKVSSRPKSPVSRAAETKRGAWRPFSDDSPWNTRIPQDPEIDPRSDELVEDMAVSSRWNFLGINIKSFSIPVYWIDSAATPKYEVRCRSITGEGFDKPVPIPEGAAPDPKSDAHMCIVDKALGMEWGMWDTHKQADGGWMCGVGAVADLKGTGVRSPHHRARPWQKAHGARAAGFPLIAGLITVEEMKFGRIDHALALAYPHCRSRYYIPPASTAQGTTNEALPTRGVPMGGLLQLDPSMDVGKLGLSKSGRIIARALQEYGMIVCDYSGAINLYAEGSEEAQKEWDKGLLRTYEISGVFDQDMLRRFRVLKMPEFYDNKN